MAATATDLIPNLPTPPPLFTDEPIEYIRLESAEGHVFFVDKNAAMLSSTIAGFFDPLLASVADLSVPILLGGIGTRALEVTVEFLYYRKRWKNVVVETIPEYKIERDPLTVQEALVAGAFLDC